MRNIYTWDVEKEELVVAQVETKSFDDIQRVVNAGKSAAVIDRFISLYLANTDANNGIADEWYTNHLLAQSLDPDEPRLEVTTADENDIETTETLPNAYEVALTNRDGLETEHEWLKGYRGLEAIERPEFVVDVANFKTDNNSLFDSYNKTQGTEISGHQISLTEENQNGIASVLTGLNLASELGADMFPMNFKANTPSGTMMIPFTSLEDFKLFAAQFMSARQFFFK